MCSSKIQLILISKFEEKKTQKLNYAGALAPIKPKPRSVSVEYTKSEPYDQIVRLISVT